MGESAALLFPDEGQKAILDMAAQCFMERGYHATSIDDVARRLGSTKGRVYHFFASKADLLLTVSEVGMDMNFRAVNPCLELDLRPLEKLRAMAKAHTLSMIGSRAYQNALWQGVEIHLRGATTPEQRERLTALVESRENYSGLFRGVMEKAAEVGEITYKDLSIARQLMFMTLNSPVFWYKEREGETAEQRASIVEQCVEFALKGLEARQIG